MKGIDEDNEEQFVGLLGDVLSGEVCLPNGSHEQNEGCSNTSSGRSCTFYKSVGTAIQDIITAEQVVKKAKDEDIGTSIDMS